MDTLIFEEYAVLDAKIKQLTKEKDEMKVEIIQNFIDSAESTAETVVGKFTLATLKTWSYTDKVKKMDENFKAQKAMEQSTGEATFEEKPSLRFTAAKF